MNFNIAIAWFDICASIATLIVMRVITPDFGVESTKAQWSLARRVVYAVVSIAFFARGTFRLTEDGFLPFWSALYQVTVVGGFLLFPALKAVQVLSKDKLLSSFHSILEVRDGTHRAQPRW